MISSKDNPSSSRSLHSHRHRDAGPLDARIAMVEIRRSDDSVLPPHTTYFCHLSLFLDYTTLGPERQAKTSEVSETSEV
jgi:hypothetical protein